MNFIHSDISQTTAILRTIADAPSEPPRDLWTRIEAAHSTRVRRRRLHRFAAGSVIGAVLVGAIALGGLHISPVVPGRGADVDWQARAQALELQLQVLERANPAAAVAAYAANPAASELVDVDQRLQSAYEHGKYTNELAPLWKRRSELLDTLIAARKEGLTLASI